MAGSKKRCARVTLGSCLTRSSSNRWATPPTRPVPAAWAAAKGGSPSSPVEHFFPDMRFMTVEAYYTSEMGLIKELGDQGGHVRGSFPGANTRPALTAKSRQ